MKRLDQIPFLFLATALALPALAHPTVSFPIVPRTRYMLTYDWVATGAVDRATVPLGTWGLFENRWYEGPLQLLEFFEPSGARNTRLRWFQPLAPGTSGSWKYEFHAPAGRTRLDLVVGDNKKKGLFVTLANIRLEEVKDAPTVNVNPDFSLGPCNFCGIAGVNGDGAALIPNPQGGYSFYGTMSFGTRAVPVEGGVRYRLEYSGWGYHKNRIEPFMDFTGTGKKFARVSPPRIYRDGKKKQDEIGTKVWEFTAPEGAEWMTLCFYYTVLDSLRLTKVQ